MSILGTRVIRTEDPRLLTAGGVYVDDLRTPELSGAARVTFVRSPVAHARITGIDTTQASQEPGVIAVLTVADMDDLAPPPPDDGSGGGGRPGASGRSVARTAARGGYGAVRRRAGRGGDHRRALPGRGRRRPGQRGLRPAARGGGTRGRGDRRGPAVPRGRDQRADREPGLHR